MIPHPPQSEPCCADAVASSLEALVRQSADFREQKVTEKTIAGRLEPAKQSAALDGHIFTSEKDQYVIGLVSMCFTIRQDEAIKLTGSDTDHDYWLAEVKAELLVKNGFWDNYRRLLAQRLPVGPLNRLDEITDQILDSLEPPTRPGQWDRRGLVMGQVQSGKTNNYTGLVCKAADAGYKLIVILAGTHNNLRAQTQFRIDEGLTGRDTRSGANSVRATGVGLEHKHGSVLSLTSATDDGDFKETTASAVGFDFGALSMPTVFVVKKNVSVLKNLHKWVDANAFKPKGHERVSGIPLLVIDDEADNASINTKNMEEDADVDPTATNFWIRKLLNSFDQTGYVGYTATPFANIFIDDQSNNEKVGDDLFPRDFLFSIPAPSNYVGPERIFGLPKVDLNEEDNAQIPLLERVTDSSNWIPPTHKSDISIPAELFPASLDRAIKSFVLACAASRARGLGHSHRSMLIHVTPFVDAQKQVRDQVSDRLIRLKNEILYDQDDESGSNAELRKIWEKDFLPASRAVLDCGADTVPLQDFGEIDRLLAATVAGIEVRMVNGSSADALDYFEHPTGLSTIVIGGAKLSRGLTLEGLVVSYYLRSTKMYDTLMQMGRWFGYRPGYLDLCRVYTTDEIIEWYRSIARATNELLDDLGRMQEINATPKDFGLRVRHSPGMMVTAQAKMRSGTNQRVSFAQSRAEVTTFDVEAATRQSCIEELENLIGSLGTPSLTDSRGHEVKNAIYWRKVSPELVVRYFDSLSFSKLYTQSKSAVPRYLADYIRSANKNGGLINWTVVLKSNSDKAAFQYQFGSHSVGLAYRKDTGGSVGTYAIKGLIGSKDEALDLPPDKIEIARTAAAKAAVASGKTGTEAYGRFYRAQRPKTNGLLVLYPLTRAKKHTVRPDAEKLPFIGYSLSLPADESAEPVSYVVNTVADRDRLTPPETRRATEDED